MDFKQLFRKKSIPQILEDLRAIDEDPAKRMVRTLGLRDLVVFGIAAIIGAGIFSTIGNAAASGDVRYGDDAERTAVDGMP